MPQYIVTVIERVNRTFEVTVDATGEADATDKARSLISEDNKTGEDVIDVDVTEIYEIPQGG